MAGADMEKVINFLKLHAVRPFVLAMAVFLSPFVLMWAFWKNFYDDLDQESKCDNIPEDWEDLR